VLHRARICGGMHKRAYELQPDDELIGTPDFQWFKMVFNQSGVIESCQDIPWGKFGLA
jgi:hypothetical protein